MREFSRLRKLKKEAEGLKREIENIRFTPREMTADTANDYRTGYPRSIKLEGYGDTEYVRRRDELYRLYAAKLAAIQDEVIALEKKLDAVEDPELRTILRLRYVDGLTLEQIGEKTGYSTRSIRRKISKWGKVGR